MSASSDRRKKPVRVYVPDRELNTTRRRNVAWRIVDRNGLELGRGKTVGDALRDAEARKAAQS
jgi:hypothetical protein